MMNAAKGKLTGAVALAMGLALSACGSVAKNQSLYSTKQAVVERTNYTLDVASGPGGLAYGEQERLADWFSAMELGYGDRVSIDDPSMSGATREAVAEVSAHHGILVSQGAPLTAGYVQPGMVRVVVTRASAFVPGCPDWSAKSQANPNNATHPNYGCATNSNIAAMVANPEDLISGQTGTGSTVVATSNKAIEAYRKKEPTGSGALSAPTSTGD